MATSTIKTGNKGSVSVTADGVKTYGELLYDLITLADTTKITQYANITIGVDVFHVSRITNDDFRFGNVTIAANDMECNALRINTAATGAHRIFSVKINSTTAVSFNDNSSLVPTSGIVFTLNY